MSEKKALTKVNITKDLICGWSSGFLTGILFMLFEYSKVYKQTRLNEPNISIFRSILNDKEFRKKFIRGAASFPILVGFVGAAEFTCNDKIRECYGKVPGIIASALSGAAFLAPGDHYMLRQEKFGEKFK